MYAITRIIFVAENWNLYSDGIGDLSLWNIIKGSLVFDTSAILYTNVVYALLMLVPIPFKEMERWQGFARGWFITVNSIALVLNLADAVYFTYTGHRTTMGVLIEFRNEGNMWSILTTECINHWYLVIAGLVMINLLRRFYVEPEELKFRRFAHMFKYCIIQILFLLIYIPLSVAGMRGGFTTAVRPVTISNANQYVNHPTEAAIVLNTPFSLIRTIGKNVFQDPKYFNEKDLNAIYSPLRNTDAKSRKAPNKKNVVVLIVESFGREYIGAYNDRLEDGKYKGYTPFVDSLLQQSLAFDYTFANGRKSIDGMPSILSSIPSFVVPFFLTPSSLNDVSGIAGELGKWGYSSAFFHGAENGSMGFEAFAKTTRYQKYYGRTEFNEDKRFRGDHDFDGTWAIWDEPFLQFYALKMSEMKEPFVTSVFTASSHHPYNIPEEYEKLFPKDKNPIHRCIRYTDMALKRFFETASKQPWFKNTIFVFTSDHTNIPDHDEYSTSLGVFGSPIFFYDPSGEMPRGRRHAIAQQIDIMPTILQYVGYPKPYIAFGSDLLSTPDKDTWAINYSNGVYQYVKGDLVVMFDGRDIDHAYNYKEDWMLRHDIKDEEKFRPQIEEMEREVKAVVQSYMQRMVNNELIVR